MSIFHRKTGDPGEKRFKFHMTKKKVILAVLILAAAGGGYVFYQRRLAAEEAASEASIKTATVTRQTITEELSGSGTISPKQTYSLTSMAEGEVTACYFEVGDQVTEGQVLYEIDASSMSSQLTSAQNTLTRAQSSLNDAEEDYAQALSDFSGNTVKSPKSGYIKSVTIAAGDDVSSGTQIAEIYDDTTMEIRVPFLSLDAQQITVGQAATLTLPDTLEQVAGTVIAVATQDETLTGGRLVRYITIQVANPGGLTTTTTASATIGDYVSAAEGTFTAEVDSTIVCSNLKSTVECEQLLVHAGDHVDVGTPLFLMDSSDAEDLIKTFKDSVDSAESSLEQAETNLEQLQDSYDEYTITAPISGTVVSRDVKVGDNIQNLSSSTALAEIYDLSSVTFEMDIDELDISNVSVGQTVTVTADAFEDETFEGEVTNVSMEGTSSNGVTYYPVTVTLTDYGGLLPGMNVEGVITLESAENVIAIPAEALQRGNVVYVKDTSTSTTTADTSAGGSGVSEESTLTGESTETSEGTAAEESSLSAESTETSEGTAAEESSLTEESTATGESGSSQAAEATESASASSESASSSSAPDGFHAVTVTTGLVTDDYVEITSGNLNEGDVIYITQSTVSSTTSETAAGGMGGAPMDSGSGGGGPQGGGGPMN